MNINTLKLDWLEMRFSSKYQFRIGNIKISENFKLVPNFEKSKIDAPNTYRTHFYLLYKEEKAAALSTNAINNYGVKNLCRLRIINQVFYMDFFKEILDELFASEVLDFIGFTRLDIAYDTSEDLVSKLMPFHRGMHNQIQNSKLGYKPIYKLCGGGGTSEIITNGVCYYHINGIAKVYNKTVELRKSKKQYQQEYFDLNGYKSAVTRLEVSLNAKKIRDHKLLIEGARLSDPDYLAIIINLIVERKLTFRTNKFKNATRETQFRVIPKIKIMQSSTLVTGKIDSGKLNSYVISCYKALMCFMGKFGDIKLSMLIDNLLDCATPEIRDWHENYSGINKLESEKKLIQQYSIK